MFPSWQIYKHVKQACCQVCVNVKITFLKEMVIVKEKRRKLDRNTQEDK
jgi:hypothetical protein